MIRHVSAKFGNHLRCLSSGGTIPVTPRPEFLVEGSSPSALHVVLVRPAMPANTGNIARLCSGLGARLHLVAPRFDIDSRKLKRAGLDYWPGVVVSLTGTSLPEEKRRMKMHGQSNDGSGSRNHGDNKYYLPDHDAAEAMEVLGRIWDEQVGRDKVHVFTKWAAPQGKGGNYVDGDKNRDPRFFNGDDGESRHFRKGHKYSHGDILVFGSEIDGLPQQFREAWMDRAAWIPQGDSVRSLNVSNAVAVAAYEALGQIDFDLPGDDDDLGVAALKSRDGVSYV